MRTVGICAWRCRPAPAASSRRNHVPRSSPHRCSTPSVRVRRLRSGAATDGWSPYVAPRAAWGRRPWRSGSPPRRRACSSTPPPGTAPWPGISAVIHSGRWPTSPGSPGRSAPRPSPPCAPSIRAGSACWPACRSLTWWGCCRRGWALRSLGNAGRWPARRSSTSGGRDLRFPSRPRAARTPSCWC